MLIYNDFTSDCLFAKKFQVFHAQLISTFYVISLTIYMILKISHLIFFGAVRE